MIKDYQSQIIGEICLLSTLLIKEWPLRAKQTCSLFETQSRYQFKMCHARNAGVGMQVTPASMILFPNSEQLRAARSVVDGCVLACPEPTMGPYATRSGSVRVK
ncbi:hypothetical protein KEM48_000149 [Puccinia striiformis f. sp. tritici PST-130]|nr:hypothetical protein KEM48_000149 [Puccinia striiformis f. sp. tritici PST-130]